MLATSMDGLLSFRIFQSVPVEPPGVESRVYLLSGQSAFQLLAALTILQSFTSTLTKRIQYLHTLSSPTGASKKEVCRYCATPIRLGIGGNIEYHGSFAQVCT